MKTTVSKIILANGPAGCGKDVSITFLQEKLPFAIEKVEFKDHLHKLTQEFFFISPEEYWEIYNDRAIKEVPLELFQVEAAAYNDLMDILYRGNSEHFYTPYTHRMNLSVRQAMIYVSEILVKPTFGLSAFGEYSAKRIENSPSSIFVDGSCGFTEELYPLIHLLGQPNIMLVRIYGRGDFAGDSRSYIPDGIIDNTVDIWNNKSEFAFLEQVYYHAGEFLLR